jgi:hypothetical protein
MRFKNLLITKLALLLVGSGLAFVMYTPEAFASAAFARQTGMSCTHCHTVRGPSQTAIGKMFFIQGYRLQSLWGEITHGDRWTFGTGREGGSFWLAETPTIYLWWRTRTIPWTMQSGDAFPEEGQTSWATIPSRWALGLGGPIGDYVSIWNEEYFQPYTESFEVTVECDVDDIGGAGTSFECDGETGEHSWDATGGNGPEYPPADDPNGEGIGYHYRFSHVEVDELDVLFHKEVSWLPPSNVFGLSVTNRGNRMPNNRGGSSIAGGAGTGGSTENGSVQVVLYDGGSWYFNYAAYVGEDVSWKEHDNFLGIAYWPWRNNQRDLMFQLELVDANDAGVSRTRDPLGALNVDQNKNYSANLIVNYVMADVGPHTLDFEFYLGYGWEEYESANGKVEYTEIVFDPGIRYFYNRTFGFTFEPQLPAIKDEQKVQGKTYKYKNKFDWELETYYVLQPNCLWYFTIAKAGGGDYCPDCLTGPTSAPSTDGYRYSILFELNY